MEYASAVCLARAAGVDCPTIESVEMLLELEEAAGCEGVQHNRAAPEKHEKPCQMNQAGWLKLLASQIVQRSQVDKGVSLQGCAHVTYVCFAWQTKLGKICKAGSL